MRSPWAIPEVLLFDVAVVALDVGGGVVLEAVVVDGVGVPVVGDVQQVAGVERLLQQQLQPVLGKLSGELLDPVCRHGRSRPWVAASHTFTVLSLLPEAMRLPSAENATLLTLSVWPLRVRTSCPVATSHTFTVLS